LRAALTALAALLAAPAAAGTRDPCGGCDDGDPCTADHCDPRANVCVHVDVNACLLSQCGLDSCLRDADGDGFSDVQEDNDYIDVDCNGRFDLQTDLRFPHAARYEFSAVTHAGSGTGQVYPTVIRSDRRVAESEVLVTILTGGPVNTATYAYRFSAAAGGPFTTRPVSDIGHNLRLLFYGGPFVAGDTYAFSAATARERKLADRNRPNVYLRYDAMDWAPPGAPCQDDFDCLGGGATPNEACHAGHCSHDHAPGDPLLRMVVDQFAAHGIALYVDPRHGTVPHATVVTFAKAGDPDNGPLAICAGADLVAGDITNGQAVSLFDLKNRPGSPFAIQPASRNVFHYAVLGHFGTCLTDAQGAPVGNCNQCPFDRSTPAGQPRAGTSGTAELPGNDLFVTLGKSFNDPAGQVPRNPFAEEGVLMHELGHNFGLHHAGDLPLPEGPPNYLSVMNPTYVLSGIQHAATPGSGVPVEALRALDYSEHTLRTLAEGALDESAGVAPLSSAYTGIVLFHDALGAIRRGPEAGPVDWTGEGTIDATPVAVDLNLLGGATETMSGYRDWDHTAGPTGAGGGLCATSADCRINAVRQAIHDTQDPTVDPHEPCVNGVCRSLSFRFQCFPWGVADQPSP
jgi:hypothetical protein